MTDAHDNHDAHADHPPHLAHHFETPAQQMESGKLGMWVFLATEILMFGGLFCAYAVYRANNPDVFLFAHRALDTKWGAINTIVLLASSFTMAWGVRAAQLGQKRLLVTMLILTLCGGGGFMVIKTIEYKAKWDHKLWVGGINAFYQTQGTLANVDDAGHAAEYIESHGHGDAHGEDHGDTHGSEAHDDHAAPADATDHADHGDTHGEHADDGHAKPAVAATWPPPLPATDVSQNKPPVLPAAGLHADLLENPHPQIHGAESFITGVGSIQGAHRGSHYPAFDELDPLEEGRTHIFFQIYFMMTGLHGFHVVVGMGLIGWIAVKSARGAFGPEYYTPVDLVGLYWHLVDLIWIFLFPLLYLIH